ncbi:MAG TPA: efflux RND transporter periplasmic adaptor subunit [Rhodanobacteraceae bacterium]|nr:efflux RND transporter periplasmic adaptor subunit [Rhodanobacteraceae bacterium]
MQTLAQRMPSTKKRMIWMVVGVLVLIAIIVAIKVLLVMRMIASFPKPTPATVSTATAEYQVWQPQLSAVGTLRAVRGADLALDVSGLVEAVNLKSGDDVKQGQVLLKLRDADDEAKLASLQATAKLAALTANRSKQQLAVQAISRAQYDTDMANLKSAQAQADAQTALVAKKTLRAPFSGRAGIITVNPGAYLNAGTTIVTVQQLDPLYVDFFVPQRELGRVHVGQKIDLSLDAFGNHPFTGQVSAINPKVDNDTRNVQIEATVPNHDGELTPGMFAKVAVDAGATQRYLTLPQTAVVYNPYGETVYTVLKKADYDKAQARSRAQGGEPVDNGAGKDKQQLPADALVVQQTFVVTGGTRGDQVSIVKGLPEGAEVVTSGQLKLKNGAPIKVDNRVRPSSNPNPTPTED